MRAALRKDTVWRPVQCEPSASARKDASYEGRSGVAVAGVVESAAGRAAAVCGTSSRTAASASSGARQNLNEVMTGTLERPGSRTREFRGFAPATLALRRVREVIRA
ncbi:hypothetical protein Sxan_01000 [Streptomyces xanthophaeus]|uniref:Uncharacterized protein n=1 Tax=Streptomyces xanthophaeus TaxID=67385 RepID=A0A919GUA3_9ACTN|nr:hypothetical protein Sxan_01000 [Streptomyces xanthophaeus]